MKEVFFKVKLLSDVVLNSKLATEGNMTTLDFIPGSNFLGIVAGKLYKRLDSQASYHLFHSGKVRFGDATLSIDGKIAYPMPNVLMMDKVNKDIGKDDVFVHSLLNPENPPLDKNGNRLQLKQQREGYILSDGAVIKELEKSFVIKSAQDRNTRTSKEGAMFGFESLTKGTEFIFSVQFDDDSKVQVVVEALEGNHRLGKSRNAEYGQINIQMISHQPRLVDSFTNVDYVMVYAQSNLCFVDDWGMPTFQPTAKQLGLGSAAEIDWDKSQIRTYSYSPWNFKRNCSSTQRDCIAKGSVFYVTGAKPTLDVNHVGLHQAEGLGKVIYNPLFIEGNAEGRSLFNFKSIGSEKVKGEMITTVKTPLAIYLAAQQTANKKEKEVSEAVRNLVYSCNNGIPKLKQISSSQWGGIRTLATKESDMALLSFKLFGKRDLSNHLEKRDEDAGYLTHGVADEKFWGKNRAANRKAFEKLFEENKRFGSQFIARFAAEMAKESRKLSIAKKS